ncbi:MAG: hypothetical protein AUJ57_06220 [Zetaproteobacteria bacterium CG1_02_53_45]|nr:MAG: hypothetical protein AUJ57_06220 [Zetaproteobacteria bacterium CG1_02_53_45]
MHFLTLQHLDIEPPALIAEAVEDAGHNLTTIRRNQGELLPSSSAGFDGIIIMGGPQSANDETADIKAEVEWVKQVLDQGKPVLGICLGAQIMAKAVGAEVSVSPIRELGWHPVYHTTESANDPLLKDMPDGLAVFQWHGETFSLTEAMTPVATHPDVPAQGFRLNRAQYGLQFHIEVDQTIIETWIAHDESERNHLGIEGIRLLHKDTALYLGAMQHFCRQMVLNWLEEAQQ